MSGNNKLGDLPFQSRNGASKHDERPNDAEAMPIFVWRLILWVTLDVIEEVGVAVKNPDQRGVKQGMWNSRRRMG